MRKFSNFMLGLVALTILPVAICLLIGAMNIPMHDGNYWGPHGIVCSLVPSMAFILLVVLLPIWLVCMVISKVVEERRRRKLGE